MVYRYTCKQSVRERRDGEREGGGERKRGRERDREGERERERERGRGREKKRGREERQRKSDVLLVFSRMQNVVLLWLSVGRRYNHVLEIVRTLHIKGSMLKRETALSVKNTATE